MPTVLITGATGYIGGPFLIWFKSQYPEYKITATSRSPASTKLLQDFGVSVVETKDLSDFQKAASEADLVVNFAGAINVPLIQALNAGLKERFEKTNARPILIHISGAGSLLDPTPFAQSEVTSDTDEAKLSAIPANHIRAVDLEVQAADEAGYLWGYIVAPPLVYGLSNSPLGRRDSLVWRAFVLPAILSRREVAYIGDGSYAWDSVHIDDLVDLLALITQHALAGKAESANSYDRFFFATNGSPTSSKAILDKIAPVLHAEGLVDNPQSVGRSVEDITQIGFLAGNIRSAADRSIALGWRPSRPTVLQGLEDEIRVAVKTE